MLRRSFREADIILAVCRDKKKKSTSADFSKLAHAFKGKDVHICKLWFFHRYPMFLILFDLSSHYFDMRYGLKRYEVYAFLLSL